jgi:hypothetical protein
MTEKVETLDYYVKRALDFFEDTGDHTLELPQSSYTLVVGSQSAYLAGRIIYRFAGRRFSHAKEVLAQSEIDAKREILGDVTIVSARGGGNIVPIAGYALNKGLRVNAIVCTAKSELNEQYGSRENYREILVEIPQERKEPPTVNTVTYGRMIQGVTHENIAAIRESVKSLAEPKGGYRQFKAFTVILPDSMPEVAEMVDWKLRGEKIGRCIGTMATYLTNFMHGAAVTDADGELYIALGLSEEEKEVFEHVLQRVPDERKHCVDVPEDFGPLGFMMLGYSVVGHIQKNYPAFQRNIADYAKRAKEWKWLSPVHSAVS